MSSNSKMNFLPTAMRGFIFAVSAFFFCFFFITTPASAQINPENPATKYNVPGPNHVEDTSEWTYEIPEDFWGPVDSTPPTDSTFLKNFAEFTLTVFVREYSRKMDSLPVVYFDDRYILRRHESKNSNVTFKKSVTDGMQIYQITNDTIEVIWLKNTIEDFWRGKVYISDKENMDYNIWFFGFDNLYVEKIDFWWQNSVADSANTEDVSKKLENFFLQIGQYSPFKESAGDDLYHKDVLEEEESDEYRDTVVGEWSIRLYDEPQGELQAVWEFAQNIQTAGGINEIHINVYSYNLLGNCAQAQSIKISKKESNRVENTKNGLVVISKEIITMEIENIDKIPMPVKPEDTGLLKKE